MQNARRLVGESARAKGFNCAIMVCIAALVGKKKSQMSMLMFRVALRRENMSPVTLGTRPPLHSVARGAVTFRLWGQSQVH
jgi:hypothetical protein